jgi:hypothetical protein
VCALQTAFAASANTLGSDGWASAKLPGCLAAHAFSVFQLIILLGEKRKKAARLPAFFFGSLRLRQPKKRL